jgi:hypothetical protein
MPSFQEINTAIADTMRTALVPTFLNAVYDYDQLPEGMNSWPAMEVYTENWETSMGGDTDRYSFAPSAGVAPRRWTNILIHMDLYARRRSHLDEDWEQALVLANEVQDALEEQSTCPLFGLAGIRHVRWTGRRVVFDRGFDPQRRPLRYTGYRFELTVGIF